MSALLAHLVVLALAGGPAPPIVTFPGPQRELQSPDSEFTISWGGSDAGKSGHYLLLRWAGSPKSWRIYSFPRSVTVSWAPSGPVFIVTDQVSADAATTIAQNTSGRKWSVCAEPQRDLGTQWSRARHRYCEHAGWTDHGELKLRLRGHGEGVSFDTQVSVPVPSE